MPALAIAICTYNRAASLRRTLTSLSGSVGLPAGEWEVLLVDNNCTDGTEGVARELVARLPLRVVRETRQGLSHARNRAVAESSADLLLFTDDDVEVDPRWAAAFLAAAAANPGAGYFGGRVVPAWPAGRPRWLHDEDLDLLSGVLGKYDLGGEVRRLGPEDPLPIGASFALRRDARARTGLFRTDLGVSGGAPGRGEETEYLRRAVRAGFTGVYVGDALCRHFVDGRRLRPRSLFRYGVHSGLAVARMSAGAPPGGSRSRAALFGARGLAQLLKGRGDRFRQCLINAGLQVGLVRAAKGR
jgi:glycosyltransferase involved in cell wall biosynthesis